MLDRVRKIGVLEGWFETGTEGVIWTLYEDGKKGYEGMHCLEDGDHLTVWEVATGRQVFKGMVKFDNKIGERLYTDFYPDAVKGLRQQCALGYWVHGIQEGFDPDSWARLFFRPKDAPELRAEVELKPVKKVVKREKPPRASPTKFRRKR